MSILAELLAGGATGVLGSISSRGLAIWEKKEERKTLLLTQAHEIALQRLNLVAKQKMLLDTNSSKDLQASYTHDSSYSGLLRWVRPLLTLLLIILSAAVYFTVAEQDDIATRILYLTTAAVLWWFTDRSRGVS